MTKKMWRVLALLLCTTAVVYAQSPTQSASDSSTNRQRARADADLPGLKTDLEKMRILLEQMQRNVAFVSPGDTPLKHQFQLEIDMWQLLLRDMEKKANPQDGADRR